MDVIYEASKETYRDTQRRPILWFARTESSSSLPWNCKHPSWMIYRSKSKQSSVLRWVTARVMGTYNVPYHDRSLWWNNVNPEGELLTLWVSSGKTTESCCIMRWQMVVVFVVVWDRWWRWELGDTACMWSGSECNPEVVTRQVQQF